MVIRSTRYALLKYNEIIITSSHDNHRSYVYKLGKKKIIFLLSKANTLVIVHENIFKDDHWTRSEENKWRNQRRIQEKEDTNRGRAKLQTIHPKKLRRKSFFFFSLSRNFKAFIIPQRKVFDYLGNEREDQKSEIRKEGREPEPLSTPFSFFLEDQPRERRILWTKVDVKRKRDNRKRKRKKRKINSSPKDRIREFVDRTMHTLNTAKGPINSLPPCSIPVATHDPRIALEEKLQ